jgi:hypothetical protein
MPLAAQALERDEVRGEVVSTSPNADQLTIRVTESGDEERGPRYHRHRRLGIDPNGG